MKNLYSQSVFRQQPIALYQNSYGVIEYTAENDQGIPKVYLSPLIWILNSMRFRVPCALIYPPQCTSEFVGIFAHSRDEFDENGLRQAHILSNNLNMSLLVIECSSFGLSEEIRRQDSADPRVKPRFKRSSADADTNCRSEPISSDVWCHDIDAAYTYLTKYQNHSPSKILVIGRGIGSEPAVYCAKTQNIGGLILIAPTTSNLRFSFNFEDVNVPILDPSPCVDHRSQISCPVLFIRNDTDEVVPIYLAEKLMNKIGGDKYVEGHKSHSIVCEECLPEIVETSKGFFIRANRADTMMSCNNIRKVVLERTRKIRFPFFRKSRNPAFARGKSSDAVLAAQTKKLHSPTSRNNSFTAIVYNPALSDDQF